jgi:hypothetical protein
LEKNSCKFIGELEPEKQCAHKNKFNPLDDERAFVEIKTRGKLIFNIQQQQTRSQPACAQAVFFVRIDEYLSEAV